MKKIALLFCLLASCTATAQKVFVDGQPISVINGNTYTVESEIGSDRCEDLVLSNDGTRLFAHNANATDLVIYDPESHSEVDVYTDFLNMSDIVAGADGFLYFSESAGFNLSKLDLSTLTVVETATNGFATQFTHRPGSEEIWIDRGEDMRIFTYDSMAFEEVVTGLSSDYDVYDIRFSPDGSNVYFFAKGFGVTAALYKMDAATRTVSTSVPVSDYYGFTNDMVVSNDGSKLYVVFAGDATDFKKLHVFSTSDLSMTDSVMLEQEASCVAEHHTRDELWLCYRGTDQVAVLDAADGFSSKATIDVGGLPSNILVTDIPSSLDDAPLAPNWRIFPNPVFHQFQFEYYTFFGYATYAITDLNGRILVSAEATKVIDISHLASGTYTLSLHDDRGAHRQLIVKL